MVLKIEGMMCDNCVKHVTKALRGVRGVTDVEVSLDKAEATLNAAADKVERLKAAVAEEGYKVTEVVL